MDTAIVWFRRDLRLHDHPALRAALEGHDRVVCAFCFDPALLGGRHASGPRTRFLLESLSELDDGLRELGSGLVIRRGRPERELATLAEQTGARSVHFSEDYSPFDRHRGARVLRALGDRGVDLRPHPGVTAVDVREVATRKGDPYTVFSPFHRAWLEAERREVLGVPRSLSPIPSQLAKGRLPSLESLGLADAVDSPPGGGVDAARRRLDSFLAGPIRDYADGRDDLAADGTSRLSPYLHFGCLTPREVEERLPRGRGAGEFRRQLAWRDFYHHVLLHFPRNARSEFQDRYRGRIRWSYAKRPFEAWCEGRTGFPLVDAAMRQLRGEGWIHNRARLVAGSFLTKDLGIDWRWGERWFMRWLVDGDEANNNGNWQWIASVGVDPAPPYRRMYNPARHQERFDPENRYVRRWVPELRDVPERFAREPWTMPPDVQREAGCVIGRDYPEPIVDRPAAREEALRRFRVD